MIDVKLNCYCYIAVLETIKLSANKTICVRKQKLKPFNCMQTNDK